MEKKSLFDVIMGDPAKGSFVLIEPKETDEEFEEQRLDNKIVIAVHKRPAFVAEEHQEIEV